MFQNPRASALRSWRPLWPRTLRRQAESLAAVALLLVVGTALSAAVAAARERHSLAFCLVGEVGLRVRVPASRCRPGRTVLQAFDDEEEEVNARLFVRDLKPGQPLNGIVTTTAPYGAFVDVGADKEGLVHISRVSVGYVDDIEKFVQPGQMVKVWVEEIDEDGKLRLSMVEDLATGDTDYSAFENIPPDQFFDGTVVQVLDYGLRVALAPPGGGDAKQGLVHISQIKDGFVEHPAEEAEMGQQVKVRVLRVIDNKLKLSMKLPSESINPHDQDVSPFVGVSPSTWLKGSVHHTAAFGIFVELQPPSGGEAVQGMVHITEIKDGFVQDPLDEVKPGQEVNVRVLNADPVGGRLSLTMKPEQDDF